MTYIIILSVILLDRFMKFLVVVNFSMNESVRVLPFLNITLLKNTGVAFSLFQGANSRLVWINSLIILFIGGVLISSKEDPPVVRAAYSLIIGGALSNMWDRIAYSGVIDFIDFKIWPVFNIADSAITAGALLMLYNIIKTRRKKRKN